MTMSREASKTVVYERGRGEPLASHEVDGSSEFLRDEDRLPESALADLPLVGWPRYERADDFGSPLRRAPRKDSAA